MSTSQRVTVTLPSATLNKAREMSNGNLSRFVAEALDLHLENLRRQQLRAALIESATAKAEEDLAIAEEFRYVDYETVMKYVPPSPELDVDNASKLSTTR